MNTRYVVVSPVRDEGEYIGLTIESMSSQVTLPVQWIIVNDGSSDNTAEIITAAAAKYPWIKTVHRPNRGFRKSGGGVVEAFDAGLAECDFQNWDFVVKLDGDLTFDREYFRRCFECFQRDPRLGIAGGAIHHAVAGRLVLEECPRFHVRGASKIYRRECWDGLGGLVTAPGWDTIDEVKAQMLGWRTETLQDLVLIHHRFTGAADGSWRNWVKNGRGSYISGYHPLFMAAKCIRRIVRKPVLVSSAALAYGYCAAWLSGERQVEDRALIRYVRAEQLKRLFGRSSIWM